MGRQFNANRLFTDQVCLDLIALKIEGNLARNGKERR